MKPQPNISLALLGIIFMSSCAGSKKIDFDSAYKFSRYNYARNSDVYKSSENKSVSKDEFIMAREQRDGLPISMVHTDQNSDDKLESPQSNSMDIEAFTRKFKQLDRHLKREIRQEVKAELKQLTNLEASTALSVNDIQQTDELTGYTKLAVLIGGGGLVLLILGAIFSTGFLSIIGALAIVAGAVLYIIDQS